MESDMNQEEQKHKEHGEQNVSRSRRQRWMWIVGVLLVVIAGLIVMVYFVPRPTNAARAWVVRTLPFPLALVNNRMIPLETFEKNVASAQHFLEKSGSANLGLGSMPTIAEIRDNEIDRLIELSIKEDLAKEKGVEVTQEAIDAYFNDQILPQAQGGMDEVNQTLEDLYDWTLDDFKKNVVYEVVLTQQLGETISSNSDVDATTKTEAENLRSEMTSSEKSFEDFAKERSDDPASGANGGSLGSFGRGVMVPEFEEAAFALPIGEISEPVKSPFGYHLIKVASKDDAAGTIEASHILIAFPSIGAEVEKRKDEARMYRFVPRYPEEEVAAPQ